MPGLLQETRAESSHIGNDINPRVLTRPKTSCTPRKTGRQLRYLKHD